MVAGMTEPRLTIRLARNRRRRPLRAAALPLALFFTGLALGLAIALGFSHG